MANFNVNGKAVIEALMLKIDHYELIKDTEGARIAAANVFAKANAAAEKESNGLRLNGGDHEAIRASRVLVRRGYDQDRAASPTTQRRAKKHSVAVEAHIASVRIGSAPNLKVEKLTTPVLKRIA